MRELERRQKVKQFFYSWPAIILMAVLTFFLAKGAAGVMLKERESAEMVGKLKAETAEVEVREAELKEGIARLNTEEGIVEEIRRKFSATREGERVAVIVDRHPGATSTEGMSRSWYRRLWSAIISLYDK
ncbi:MAG: hypothetical protein A2758_01720 [Candidatus Zambryskibacteria bacterium RIFCSPHIGHO2_01_FULL_49_18]|uniref:Septum formation initiator n=1 Tax=Candidatus Zambryskibacteria bacterium RIFCSPHIGHO2_01_FULL_49_18 TaxID=1802740 RepID=A0A1G2T1K8_9BACT|nr:MAG: hypothetical protein A2758_01720 [Candidatus Zambryskibacteria bacterium RIFCSPHIGHO2_01_FULL_49_18]